MLRIQFSRSRLLLGTVAFCAAAVVGGLTVANAADDKADVPSAKFDIPTGVTKDGRTYGSELDSLHGKPAPDLVAVVGDHGKLGYVDAKSLATIGDSDSDAARAKSNALKADGKLSLPVYATDGVTQIDTFTNGARPRFSVKYNDDEASLN